MIYYLGTPYSHPNPKVVETRYDVVNLITLELMKRGQVIFSPITHSHVLNKIENCPGTWEFWKEQDLGILRFCGRLLVLMLPGWGMSVGLNAEIMFAYQAGIPVSHLNPESFPIDDQLTFLRENQ